MGFTWKCDESKAKQSKAKHFTDNTGEEWITNKIANVFGGASKAEVTKALQALPNYRIPAVTVTDSNRDSTTRSFTVMFNNDRVSGNQSTGIFTFDSPLGCQVAGCHPKYYQSQLTTIKTLAVGGAFTPGTTVDPIFWTVTDDSVFDKSLIASGDFPVAGTFGATTFRARVTVNPSTGIADTASSLPAHSYKVDWDLTKHYAANGGDGALNSCLGSTPRVRVCSHDPRSRVLCNSRVIVSPHSLPNPSTCVSTIRDVLRALVRHRGVG